MLRPNKPLSLTILLLPALLAGCASKPPKPSFDDRMRTVTQQDGKACVRQSDIRGFGSSRDSITIEGRRKKYYVATLLYDCPNLGTAFTIGFADRFNEICGGRGNLIAVGDSTCRIKGLYEFDDRTAAFLAIEAVEKLMER
ncbi:MAG: DUF6491 family protein [Xanthomonadales bacterium]|nr:DUF6491 family protein [Xanthomonadales bacterium]